jgi:hypothetical protein
MCNLEGSNVTGLARSVARVFLTGLRPAPDPTPTHSLTSGEAAQLTGLYRSREPVGTLTVEFSDGTLIVPRVARLVARSPTRFVTGDLFTYDFDGQGGLRTRDEFGQVVVYERVDPSRPSAAELVQFTGRYTSDEVNATVELAVRDGQLVIRRPPDWNIALTPVFPDGFHGDLGWITFERNGSGQIDRLNVSMDRMWRLPFVRLPDGPGPSRANDRRR